MHMHMHTTSQVKNLIFSRLIRGNENLLIGKTKKNIIGTFIVLAQHVYCALTCDCRYLILVCSCFQVHATYTFVLKYIKMIIYK